MSGKPKHIIDMERLRVMYLDRSIGLDTISKRFDYSRRQIAYIIASQRKEDPSKWPKRFKTN